MALTLTSPIARPNATEWRISEFHVYEVESPQGSIPRVSATFHLVTAGGVIVDTAAWVCQDFSAFQTEANTTQTGTTFQRMRKAVLARAQAEGALGAGSIS